MIATEANRKRKAQAKAGSSQPDPMMSEVMIWGNAGKVAKRKMRPQQAGGTPKPKKAPAKREASQSSAAAGNPEPKKKKASAAASETEKVVYKSVQQREISNALALLDKCAHLVAAAGTSEGFDNLIVDKLHNARVALEKKGTDVFMHKLRARHAEPDDVSEHCNEVAQPFSKTFGQLEALEFLVRSLSATSSEDVLFWQPQSIHAAVSRCESLSVTLCCDVKQHCVRRQIEVVALVCFDNNDEPEQVLFYMHATPQDNIIDGFGLWYAEDWEEAPNGDLQDELLYLILQRAFEKEQAHALSERAIQKDSGVVQFPWIIKNDARLTMYNFAVVLGRVAEVRLPGTNLFLTITITTTTATLICYSYYHGPGMVATGL